MAKAESARESSSFRDPSGYIFYANKTLFRSVHTRYADHYRHLMQSGLYADLAKSGQLIAHDEVALRNFGKEHLRAFKILRPERVKTITYPYEWCFQQLRDAALLTLGIQKRALDFGMTLKDASAYNIQFHRGHPIFIDSLSFEIYKEGSPWVAYAQFCRHFLAPLALASYTDTQLHRLLALHIDGIPLDLASRLLPVRTYFRFGMLAHIHLHARSTHRISSTRPEQVNITKHGLRALIESVEKAVRKLRSTRAKSHWANYVRENNYSKRAMEHKKQIVAKYLGAIDPQHVCDFGANTGEFSRIAAESGCNTIALDLDPAAVDAAYVRARKDNIATLLPLVVDITNPSPAIGWNNLERKALFERLPRDTTLALALLHHLVIANNIPLQNLAEFFAERSQHLVIEFVPKSDSQVQRLLASREDIFEDYTRENFEKILAKFFHIKARTAIDESERCVYWMQNRKTR